MKKQILTFAVILLLSAPAALLADMPPRGVVAIETGTSFTKASCASEGCVGDLVTCPVGQVLLAGHGTFSFWEGVCDDAGSIPCDGRVAGYSEECYDPAFPGPNIRLAGPIVQFTAQGPYRNCFDPAATPDNPARCDGSEADLTAAGIEVFSRGTITAHESAQLFGTSAPVRAIIEAQATHNKSFHIDGHKVKNKTEVFTIFFTAQPDPDGDNCTMANGGIPGCGAAGVLVSTVRK